MTPTDGKNIANAFYVVRKTYDSVNKLFRHFAEDSFADATGYFLAIDNYVRWVSRGDNSDGWLINSFIFIFQRKSDALLDNGWRDGPLFVTEISFWDEDESHVTFARCDYDLFKWQTHVWSPNAHGKLADIWNRDMGKKTVLANGVTHLVVSESKYDSYYSLKSADWLKVPLVEVTSQSCDALFKVCFDKLSASE